MKTAEAFSPVIVRAHPQGGYTHAIARAYAPTGEVIARIYRGWFRTRREAQTALPTLRVAAA